MDVEGKFENDNARISNYLKNSDLIEQYVIRAKKIKILKVFFFFPYSLDFALKTVLVKIILTVL